MPADGEKLDPGDTAEWTPFGAETQLVTVYAVDTSTEPPTYIVKLPDGSRRGARQAHLKRAVATALDRLTQEESGTAAATSMLAGAAKRAGGFVAGLKGRFVRKGAEEEDGDAVSRKSTGSGMLPPPKGGKKHEDPSSEDGLAMLVAMGFPRDEARAALSRCGGNVADAAAQLASPPSPPPAAAADSMPGWQRVAMGLDDGPSAPASEPATQPQREPPRQPAVAPAARAPAPAAPAAPALRTRSAPSPGIVELEWDPPPPLLLPGQGAAAPEAVSLGMREAGSQRWTHHVGQDGVARPFPQAGSWRTACLQPGARTCTVRGLAPGSYEFAVRCATARGPGPPCAPLTVHVPENPASAPQPVPGAQPAAAAATATPPAATDFDDFFGSLGSKSPSPAGGVSPPAQRPARGGVSPPLGVSPAVSPKRPAGQPVKTWPTHPPGRIWDVD
eukprot:TRINITY_DN70108_c0_g1_i1.p1 TRINITY_DN70108_c0_g1~~TRINITY_DN70108_c0_g1_i1.p1  ORF type:complete len:472 (+),score=62.32 TRINITY_DN70108_c0_g1_i1:80-1417(+)